MQGLKFCLQWIADNDEGYETNPNGFKASGEIGAIANSVKEEIAL
jgi:hypothetical protein